MDPALGLPPAAQALQAELLSQPASDAPAEDGPSADAIAASLLDEGRLFTTKAREDVDARGARGDKTRLLLTVESLNNQHGRLIAQGEAAVAADAQATASENREDRLNNNFSGLCVELLLQCSLQALQTGRKESIEVRGALLISCVMSRMLFRCIGCCIVELTVSRNEKSQNAHSTALLPFSASNVSCSSVRLA